eukprot:363901-Chlamydomonas_euryale.AAC.20
MTYTALITATRCLRHDHVCCAECRSQRKGKKGGLLLEYRMSDTGPVQSLRPGWVPQLQMHCFAAGTPSVLVLSRSATRGLRLYRVVRNEAYIQRMLDCLTLLQTRHVSPQAVPDPSLYHGLTSHVELLDQTSRIAAGATLLLEVPSTPIVEGADDNAFWQGRMSKQ